MKSIDYMLQWQKDFKCDMFDVYASISGTARFEKEPTVQNVKNVNLKKLSEDLWMLNQDTILSGSNMNVKNMTIRANVTANVSVEDSLVFWNLTSITD